VAISAGRNRRLTNALPGNRYARLHVTTRSNETRSGTIRADRDALTGRRIVNRPGSYKSKRSCNRKHATVNRNDNRMVIYGGHCSFLEKLISFVIRF